MYQIKPFMKTSIFVIVLIVVVFMAGALILSMAYEKRAGNTKTSTIVSEHFAIKPVAFVIDNEEYAAEPKKVLFKPIVMDLGLSSAHPF
jgi:uncharacterized membrane protein